MSNNIYDILKKMAGLEAPKQALTESKKAKPDFADLDKDGDKTEPMKKAAKDKSKGAVAEAVAQVEKQLSEKYMGFKKTVAAIKKGGSADNPEAVAAAIGRKKYGKEKFQKAAAAGKKLGEDYQSDMKAKDKASRDAEFKADMEFVKSGGGHVDTSGTAYDRHGNPAFGVETKRKLEKNRDYPLYRQPGIGDGMPDRPVPGKMQEDDMEEGNEFSGELAKAKAQGKDSFEVDGKQYPVKEGRAGMREGWDEMQKYLEKKRGPESKGDAGKKAGTRYGGSAQRDDSEDVDGEGQPAVKKKGRPKGTGGGAKFSFRKPKD